MNIMTETKTQKSMERMTAEQRKAGAAEAILRTQMTAIHEAGHVLGCRLGGYPVTTATVQPTKTTLGRVSSSRLKGWDDAIIEALLGHAAELEFGFQKSYGYETDYRHAEAELKELLRIQKSKAWSQKTGLRGTTFNHLSKQTESCNIYTHWDVPDGGCRDAKGSFVSYHADWKKAVRISKSEWKSVFDGYVRKARRLAKKHRTYIETVANLLMEKQKLTDAEIPQLEETRG
jgi:hypothetical protein